MEDKVLVFIAGGSDAYPLEYYDEKAEAYRGLVPCLLEDFSAESDYQVVYYDKTDGDRESLWRNVQADMVYECVPAEALPQEEVREEQEEEQEEERLVLFETQQQGQTLLHCLRFTEAAPEGLKEELAGFFSGVSQTQISGMLLECAEASAPTNGHYPFFAGLALGASVLAACLALTVRHYRQRLQKARRLLEEDAVTGLGNFSYMQRASDRMLNEKNRALYDMICFSVDAERLRLLADHGGIDKALAHCATVLRRDVGKGDILAKVDDFSFALLRLNVGAEPVRTWTVKILQQMRAYPKESANPYELRVSAGVYSLKRDDSDLKKTVLRAARAADNALRERKDLVMDSEETSKAIETGKQLRATVEKALESREFQLFIQFYVDTATRRIVGGEALSRWLHPTYGLLTPGEFMPLLEKEGLTYKLDYSCLHAACGFLQRLTDCGIEGFFISCNFSRETFSAADFPQKCLEILSHYRFPRDLLMFELTESVVARHPEQIHSNILQLKAHGVRIVLDDFGKGFTAFSDLQQYPVDGLKLDKALIDNLHTPTGFAIVRGMVRVARDLGLAVLAEGVESEEQVQSLQQCHCDIIQGFLYSVPMPEAEAMDRVFRQFRQEKDGPLSGQEDTPR